MKNETLQLLNYCSESGVWLCFISSSLCVCVQFLGIFYREVWIKWEKKLCFQEKTSIITVMLLMEIISFLSILAEFPPCALSKERQYSYILKLLGYPQRLLSGLRTTVA